MRLCHYKPLSERPTLAAMRASKRKAEKLQRWRAMLLRSRGEVLGYVQASDERSVETAAVKTFSLSEQQRSRLVVNEMAE